VGVGATIAGRGTFSLDVGVNTFHVLVISPDGTREKDYKIVVNRANNTGIEENSTAALQIYPNPAKEYINIVLPENSPKGEFILYDLQGKALINQHIDKAGVVDMQHLASGIYMYHITASKAVYNGKIVKQ
jgi:hypothetical protein